MQKNEFESLIATFRFLEAALEHPACSMTTSDRSALANERTEAFNRLLTEPSNVPSITIRQLRALLECLENAPGDAELSRFVTAACLRHIEQLERLVTSEQPPTSQVVSQDVASLDGLPSTSRLGGLDGAQLQLLEASSDRIVLIGPDYLYRYSNPANARFHGVAPNSLVGKPIWLTTSNSFFAEVTKPAIDRCFAGRAVAFRAAHPGRDPSTVYSARLDPVRDRQGRVVAILASARAIAA